MAQKHKTPQLRCINLSNRQTHWTCVAHSGPLQPNILVLFSPPNFTSVICGLWVPYGAHCIPVLVLWESRSALLYILYIYISPCSSGNVFRFILVTIEACSRRRHVLNTYCKSKSKYIIQYHFSVYIFMSCMSLWSLLEPPRKWNGKT